MSAVDDALRALRVAARGFARAEAEAAKAHPSPHAPDPLVAMFTLSDAALAYARAIGAVTEADA